MEAFEDYGQGLTLDMSCLGENRGQVFHLHPHYELLICTYAPKAETILCGQRLSTDFPFAVLVSAFIPHFVSVARSDAWKWHRLVLYFGDETYNRCMLPFTANELLSGGAACIYDMRGYFGKMREYANRIEREPDPWMRERLLGAILHEFWKHRDRSNPVMNRPDDYILKVIDYVKTHPEEKLTADILAGMFYVSRDKLKKDFKRSTYMNLGDFIQAMRMNLAKELLRKRVPVNEVIRRCGYESSSYFFKRFKAETGETPFRFER